MKKFTSICFLAVMLTLLTGCLMVSSIGGTGGGYIVQGSGEIVSRDFTVGIFTGIDIEGAYVVVYTSSQINAVTVSMHENLFDYLEVSVNRSGVLEIRSTRPFRTSRNNTPRVYISAPYLNEIHIGGALTTEGWDTIRTQHLTMNAAGAASATIDMEVDMLSITVAGAGTFDLSGNAATANIIIAGAGSVDAEDLQTRTATLNLAGAGNAVIAVSDVLNVTISGVGTVHYIGDPQVNRTIAGLGTVRQR